MMKSFSLDNFVSINLSSYMKITFKLTTESVRSVKVGFQIKSKNFLV